MSSVDPDRALLEVRDMVSSLDRPDWEYLAEQQAGLNRSAVRRYHAMIQRKRWAVPLLLAGTITGGVLIGLGIASGSALLATLCCLIGTAAVWLGAKPAFRTGDTLRTLKLPYPRPVKLHLETQPQPDGRGLSGYIKAWMPDQRGGSSLTILGVVDLAEDEAMLRQATDMIQKLYQELFRHEGLLNEGREEALRSRGMVTSLTDDEAPTGRQGGRLATVAYPGQ